MATSSSSTKKAAKLAQKGKGQKVRFQGGTLFPMVVAATLILGLALIVYARQSLPAADESRPTINDHWHAAYGFYLCDTWYKLDGNLEERDTRGQFTNLNFSRSGIHSHDDWTIHWHPYTSVAVGKNATLGVFLDSYGVELTNDTLKFPPENVLGFTDEYIEGETQCNGEDAELSVKAWQSFTDTDNGQRYIANMDQVHIDQDQMVFGIYFTARGTPQPMPPEAANLLANVSADTNQIRPEDLLQGDTSVVIGGDSTVPGITTDSSPVDSTPVDTTPAETAPAETTPVATTVAGG